MANNLLDAIRSGARGIPGGETAIDAARAATSGSLRAAAWAAREFARFGRTVGGTPGELSAGLFGAGMGAIGGFFLGPLLGNNLVPGLGSSPQQIPRAARSVEMEEVFSLYAVGRGKFGEDPRYTAIEMNLYDLAGSWCGFLLGLQLNTTPPAQLFQPAPHPGGPVEQLPVQRVDITEWTNGHYVLADGSTLITEGIVRSYLVPQRDGSLLFMVTNSHVIARGTGAYDGARGIKQGIGAVYVPPGEFPAKFPAPGYEFPVNTIDTFRLIKKNFLAPSDEFSRRRSLAQRPAPPAPVSEPAGALPSRQGHGASGVGANVLDSLLAGFGNASPFEDLRLPEVPDADPRAYQNANQFRRFGTGEAQLAQDGKSLIFRGELRSLDGRRDGRFMGSYELVEALSSVDRVSSPARPPFNLQTLAISTVPPHAFCQQRWEFADGSSLTAVGPASLHSAEILTGQTVLWISTSQRFSQGTGRFQGARGVQTTGMAIVLPAGQSLREATHVTLKTIELFIVLPQEFIGELQLFPGPPAPAGPASSTERQVPLKSPVGVAADVQGNVYVGDHDNHAIRKITPEGALSTLAGAPGEQGSTDGRGSGARFHGPRGVAVDAQGNVYVADNLNHTIRKVTPDGQVSTLAGAAGEPGAVDGQGAAARFNSPMGMALDAAGNIYVADFENFAIRKITPDGVVSTLAGAPGKAGAADGQGSAARFNFAGGIGVDGAGNVYVGDTGNHTVRKITPGGRVSTLVGISGQAASDDGYGSARFNRPGGVAVDAAGNLYVAGNGDHTVRKITPGGVVSTLAGTPGEAGYADGRGRAARFKGPIGIAVDAQGNVYVGDTENNAVRRITPEGVVSTLAGSSGQGQGG